jgi:flagellar biosynthesis protein FlhG
VSNRLSEFWVFVSGKGGVGKSVLALNTARALFEQGKRVLLLDADLGLGNLHVLANVEPHGRLERVLARADDLDEAITPLDFGPDLLASENGQSLCMLAGSDAAEELAETLGLLNSRYDYILVDTPRGISDPGLQFCRACDRIVLVTSDEPTAITNSYAWYKSAMLDGSPPPVWLVANGTSEVTLPDRFSELCRRFLGHAPRWAGSIPYDASVGESVAMQRPLCECSPDSPAWEAIKHLSRILQITENEEDSSGPACPGSGPYRAQWAG